MNRKNMIDELRQAGIRAVPTVVTYDMGLQYDYVTSDGAGTGIGGIGRWPLWRFQAIDKNEWNNIVKRVKDQSLSIQDLTGTEFELFIDNVPVLGNDAVDYARFLSGLLDLKWTGEAFYCLYDHGMWYDARSSIPVFASTEKEILHIFSERYCSSVTPWDSMSNEEVTSWFNRLTDDLGETPYVEFERL